MYEYRCDERLKVKGEGSTHLGYTGLGLVTFTKYVVFCLKDILYQLQNIFRQVNGVGNVFGTSPRVRRSANLTHWRSGWGNRRSGRGVLIGALWMGDLESSEEVLRENQDRDFLGVLIDLMIGFLGLIIKAFDNQTEI
jgi:hypothetical protein